MPAASFAPVPTVTVSCIPSLRAGKQRYILGLIQPACEPAQQVPPGETEIAAAVEVGSMSREKLSEIPASVGTARLPGAGDIPSTSSGTVGSRIEKKTGAAWR